MKIETITFTASRTSNFEKVELSVSASVQEGDKFKNVVSDLTNAVNIMVDAEYKKMVFRQEKEREERARLEEEARKQQALLLASLPKTKEEALKVQLEDGTPLEDLSLKKLSELVEQYEDNSLIGRAVRLITGEVAEEGAMVETPTKSVNNNSELEIALNYPVPKRFNLYSPDANRSLASANDKELQFLIKADKASPTLKKYAKIVLDSRK